MLRIEVPPGASEQRLVPGRVLLVDNSYHGVLLVEPRIVRHAVFLDYVEIDEHLHANFERDGLYGIEKAIIGHAPDDMVVMDLGGNKIEGTYKPSSDTNRS